MDGQNQTLAYDLLLKKVIVNLRPLVIKDGDLLNLLGAGLLIRSIFLSLCSFEECKRYYHDLYGEHEGEFMMQHLSSAVLETDKTEKAFDEAYGDDPVDSICHVEMLLREVYKKERSD